jgi:hypothetical protein
LTGQPAQALRSSCDLQTFTSSLQQTRTKTPSALNTSRSDRPDLVFQRDRLPCRQYTHGVQASDAREQRSSRKRLVAIVRKRKLGWWRWAEIVPELRTQPIVSHGTGLGHSVFANRRQWGS